MERWMFAEVRRKTKWVALGLLLSGEDHDGGDGMVPDDIDDPFL
jgi:hypothetical protein